jgi:hypothetical protein
VVAFALLIIAWGASSWLGGHNLFVATNDEPGATCPNDYPCLNRLVYMTETVLPVIGFGQRDAWRVDTSAPYGELVQAAQFVSALPPAALLQALPREWREHPTFTPAATHTWAPILNLHVWYDRPIGDFDFVAFVNSPVQWVFNRTRIAGLPGPGQYVTVSLSAAWEFWPLTKEELRERFIPELARLFPPARDARVERFVIVKEQHATFRSLPGSPAVRPPAKTPIRTLLLAGDITQCGTGASNNRDEGTAKLIDEEIVRDPAATVFTLGDNAYPEGRAEDYKNCYHPTWGRHKDRTYANLGNHEYDSGSANPTWDYFGDRAGPRGKGYYSLNIGDWHIIVLNDNNSFVPFTAGSEQDKWLVADLAANTKPCIMAIMHQSRFYSHTSSGTVRSKWKIFWDRLWAAGADVIFSGHQHRYERFAPMKPDGTRDDVGGIRQFIVGTGGESTSTPTVIAANSEVVSAAFGIMRLTLLSTAYEWKFIPLPGHSTFTDSGSGTCH